MPLYEYVCSECGARFTKLEPMSAPRDERECPQCGKRQGHRVVSAFAKSGGDSSSGACGPASSPFR